MNLFCPSHRTKLEKISPPHTEVCELCARPAYYECKSCKYIQCFQCRICDKKHHLVKMIELNKTNQDYYNNGYVCNNCKKNKTADDDGLYHCGQCTFDLCNECGD